MDEYIRREDVLKGKKTGTFANGICLVAEPCVTVKYIESIEPADIVQVVHAYWIQTSAEDEDGNAYYSCSNCGSGESHNPIVEVPYCWKCGAKMDGGNYDSLHN